MITYPDDFLARTTYPQHDPAYIDPSAQRYAPPIAPEDRKPRVECASFNCPGFVEADSDSPFCRNCQPEQGEGTVGFWALIRDTDAAGGFDHLKVLFIIALLVFAPYLVSWMVAAR